MSWEYEQERFEMTKNEMAILLHANAGEVREVGYFSYYGFLLDRGYATQFGPGINEYEIFTAEQVEFIEKVAKNKMVKELWESGDLDAPGDNYDAIESGLRIYEELNIVLPDNQYYRFSDDSLDIFESYEEAESEARMRMFGAGFQEITPFLALSKDKLEELCNTFDLDYDDFLKIKDADEILEELEGQMVNAELKIKKATAGSRN
jgi:hypothetical protein